MNALFSVDAHPGDTQQDPRAWARKQRDSLGDLMDRVGIDASEDALADALNAAQEDPESLAAAVARVVGALWLIEFASDAQLPWLMLELGRADSVLKAHKLLPSVKTGAKIRKNLDQGRERANAAKQSAPKERVQICKRVMLESGLLDGRELTGMVQAAYAAVNIHVEKSALYRDLGEARAALAERFKNLSHAG